MTNVATFSQPFSTQTCHQRPKRFRGIAGLHGLRHSLGHGGARQDKAAYRMPAMPRKRFGP
jgi:hypothetical protein